MKISSPIFLILLISILHLSCSEQTKVNSPRENLKEAITTPVKTEQPEVDRYFDGTSIIVNPKGPETITRNIIQDKKGNYWLATWDGIIKYDGKTFVNFTNKEDLRRFRVFSILEDRTGNIWFGTIGAGIYKYDGKSFTNLTTEDGLVNNDVTCITEDSKGNIWFGTQAGLSIYDGKSFTNYTTDQGIPSDDINSIVEDKDGQFWLGTRGEACWFDGKKFTSIEDPNGAPFINVRSILKDTKGNIWLGGNDGLWRFYNSIFTKISKPFVGYIYEDKKGNVWTSSESSNGQGTWVLSKYSKAALASETIVATPIFEKKDMFFGIMEDRAGAIWFGSLNGVLRYDGVGVDDFTGAGGKQ